MRNKALICLDLPYKHSSLTMMLSLMMKSLNNNAVFWPTAIIRMKCSNNPLTTFSKVPSFVSLSFFSLLTIIVMKNID